MNLEVILGLVRHLLTFAGGILVTKGLATDSQVADIVGALATLIGAIWSIYHKFQTTKIPAADPPAPTRTATRLIGFWLFAFSAFFAVAFSGCGTPGKYGEVMSVSSWGVGTRLTATSQTTGTPEVWLGVFRQTVNYAPTSTNQIYAPRTGTAFQSSQTAWNPLSTTAAESFFTGDVEVRTNATGGAIVPKLGPP